MCDDLGISDQKIEVYELEIFGSKIILRDLKDVAGIIETDLSDIDPDSPEEITITKKIMRESEFENMPEFEGY